MAEPSKELKKIIEETIKLVAKNGIIFENKLISDAYRTNNPKLCFLKEENQYNSFYKENLEEYKKLIITQKEESIKQSLDNCKDLFKLSYPQSISTEQDEIIKLTTQFIANNGQEFLNIIQKREVNNPLYNFLKPTNKYFPYFTDLLRSYMNSIIIKNDLKNKLTIYSALKKDIINIDYYLKNKESLKNTNFLTENNIILKRAKEQFLKEKALNDIKIEKEKKEKEDKEKIALINWDNFIVVETIKLNDDNYITDTTSIEQSIINQNINNINKKDEKIKIVKNFNSNNTLTINSQTSTIKCPICKLEINENDYDHHIKIELLDPKWKEVKDEINKRKQMNTHTNNLDMITYLNEFVSSITKEDSSNILTTNNESKSNSQVNQESSWDGFAPNITRTTANLAMIVNQNKKNYEENKKIEEAQKIDLMNVYEKNNFQQNKEFDSILLLSNLGESNKLESTPINKIEAITNNKNDNNMISAKPLSIILQLSDQKSINLNIIQNITVLELKKNILRIYPNIGFSVNELNLIIKDGHITLLNNEILAKYELNEGATIEVHKN